MRVIGCVLSVTTIAMRTMYKTAKKITTRISYQIRAAPWKTITKFMRKRATPKVVAKQNWHFPIANSLIIFLSAANLISGTSAKGSWTDCRMLSQVSRLTSYSWPKKDTARAGKIAMDLVNRTLFQTGRVKSRKPSITNCPA